MKHTAGTVLVVAAFILAMGFAPALAQNAVNSTSSPTPNVTMSAAPPPVAVPTSSPTPGDEKAEKKILDRLAIIISLFAFLLSFFVAKDAWRFNEISARRASRETHMKMLFDVGQLQVNFPELGALYDTHPLAKERNTSPRERAKREAFFFQHLNIFDLVWDYYTRLLKRNFIWNYLLHRMKADAGDKDYWEAWQRYMLQFFRDSSEARRFFLDVRTREIYSKEFVKYIYDIVEPLESNSHKGAHTQVSSELKHPNQSMQETIPSSDT